MIACSIFPDTQNQVAMFYCQRKKPARLAQKFAEGNVTATQKKQIILLSVAHLNSCTSPDEQLTDRLFIQVL